ncbi:MAG: hypothetical protein M9916_10860 [Crocinitomicaceae bacterium]|nr:hypothetical protein [Crocinitomicaceae bacterium]
MDQLRQKPFLIFLIFFLLISIPLWTLPIQLFPGVIEYESGMQELKIDAPLSLSHFIGLGLNEGDLDNVKTFYLKPSGYALAVAFLIGIPAVIALRISKKHKK